MIVILVITAIKDAIEDYRRTILDNELNNAPVHRLTGWNNVNVEEDRIGAWRHFKKANTRIFGAFWHATERLWKKKKQPGSERRESDPRHSVDSATMSRERDFTASPDLQRRSLMSTHEMTPMSTPGNTLQPWDHDERPQSYLPSPDDNTMVLPKGDLINRAREPGETARFHRSAWRNLVVGDFVRIYNDDEIPADIIILATSDPDGACYVETKNLDGETNLKVRSALRSGRTLKHARDCARAEFVINSEPPQPNLYKYNGNALWSQRSSDDPASPAMERSEPITIDNMLLRGCNLRNTDWALGVVVFTGHDTKIMMNAGITPSKRPRIARELNFNVICNFGILFLMCLVAAIANGVAWGKEDASLNWFEYQTGNTAALSGFINLWASLIVFQNLVPISLYISLEIVRTLQAYFIYSDLGMYHDQIDQPCVPKSWNISDDVGQIEYIFSDKTGTLTQNVMEFKKATINGQPYGEAYTEAQAGMDKQRGVDVVSEGARIRAEIAEAKARTLGGLRKMHDNPYLHDDELTFVAPDFVDDLAGQNGSEQQQANERFMLALALCHTVVAEKHDGDPPRMVFKAQSPDEAALVATARDMGFTVVGMANDGINVNVIGEDRHYPVLNIIEFNSTRKRMSAIVKMPDGRILLICKGADSVIYSRLRRGEQRELREMTSQHLEMFAREGLRTLCIAERELSEKEYSEWRKEHDVAAAALKDREERLEEVADKIEQNLMLLGGTAIEDRLQDGVPDTIEVLGHAGIKLWVLTGDKVETAINIGFSCNLLNNDMDLIRLRIDEDESGALSEDDYLKLAEEELAQHLAVFNLTGGDEDLKRARGEHEPPAPTHGLVIDGFTLRWVLSDTLKQKFLLLCKECRSVLCCRVSPAQKAAVVSMVKNGLDVMTLSIGDGANDVAMIQEADVGVGIAGVEGRQAVMSSDYAIGQFRFLQRLVIVHGRWSYRRVAEAISNFFYKNMVWTWAIFWFQIFCNFDISYIFDYTYILMFNLFFTSVPVILLGVLDQDVSPEVALQVPELYRRGIERAEWTQHKFWAYMGDGIYQSVVSFFIPFVVVTLTAAASGNGLDVSERLRLGCYIAHPAVLTINMYILINTYRWDWLMVLVIVLSDLFIFFWTGVYTTGTYSSQFYLAAPEVYQELTFWMTFIVTPTICLLPRLVVKCFQKIHLPYDVDIIREQVAMGILQDRDSRQVVALGHGSQPEEGSLGSSGLSPQKSGVGPRHSFAVQNATASIDEDRWPINGSPVVRHAQSNSGETNYTVRTGPSLDATTPVDQDDFDHHYREHRLYADDFRYEQPQPSKSESDPLPRHQPSHLLSAYPLTATSSRDARPSIERARPSYDRVRASMERVRPSFQCDDFTSAARLSRLESSRSATHGDDGEESPGPRRFGLAAVRNRGLSVFSKKDIDLQNFN